MKKIIKQMIPACILTCLLFSVVSCSGNRPKVVYEQKKSETITTLGFRSPAVNRAVLEKNRVVDLYIVLPESYASSEKKRYPVVYGLHGLGYSPRSIVTPLASALDSENLREVIFVGIDGTCNQRGSFYANSPVSGYWEDAIIKEIIPFIDRTYRTERKSTGRMLAGFSAGGFSAWNLALKYPEVFCAAWACSPGAWDRNGLKDTLAMWRPVYKNAYGAAFSPDINLSYPYARIPTFDGTYGDAKLQEAWEEGYGNIVKKLKAYKEKSGQLSGISLTYGSHDEYKWIPRGVRYLAEEMDAAGVPVEIREYSGGHLFTTEAIARSFIPFVRRIFLSSAN